MNTSATPLYREVACAAAAVLITVIASLSFVQSTALAPDFHAQVQAEHGVDQAERA